ncbi:MAG: DUF4294 domain-containing protein [Bacteroidota bacterium]|nr:DUF4294 domain-containing protein [Bacteroidota bacterium]MDX5404432.1 DUF4294 domain-containing protein [Bacteroidota bacterium]MDX5446999.1 DUF4294 domain-containing protein [Bacteroidota bacterium]
MAFPRNRSGRSTVRLKDLFLTLLLCWSSGVFAQQPTSGEQPDTNTIIPPTKVFPITIIDGDTIAWGVLDEILVSSTPTVSDREARRRYLILQRKVYKVYPYAIMAGDKLDSLNLKLDNLTSKRKRKKYIKEYQQFLEERFEPELRKLTRSEGQILSKLIHRETGMTVYELISEYRSGWTAFWWNVSANWYDISLKTPYEPERIDEDKLIEAILRQAFARGILYERIPFYPPVAEDQ